MKYSKRFDETYAFYLKNVAVFNFCGTLNPKFEAIKSDNGKSAKECFFFIESEGKNKPCCEPELLNQLLLTKASVNFQIKEWAQGRADGTLPLLDFSKRLALIGRPMRYIKSILKDNKVLEWINNEPVYYRDIQKQYGLPEWVITAVENQKGQYYK